VVVSPDDTGIAQARAKTDRLDARALAALLWRGELEAVWMPDERCRVLRRRLARRQQLIWARTRSKNEIHAVLARRLQGKPPCSDLFGVKGRVWLDGLTLPVEERESVDAGIRHIAFLDAEIAAVDRLIARQALDRPEIRRLMTVTGVNVVCAATFMAAVGHADRFITARKLVAYLGLDLKVRQSGHTPARSGRISQRGSASARWALVEAAWSVARQPGPLHAFYERTRARRGHGKAIVATARKLAILFWLVHADPRSGLRPPTAIADPQEAAPARDRRRRSQEHPFKRRHLVHPRADAHRRARTRPASRGVLPPDGQRPARWRTGQESGRERDTGARINLGPRRAKPRGRPKAPDVCTLLRRSPAPTNNLTHRDDDGKVRDNPACAKFRANTSTRHPRRRPAPLTVTRTQVPKPNRQPKGCR